MYKSFENCESLVSINLSCFKATKLSRASWLFHNCFSLVSVDLSNFETTSSLLYIGSMFRNCTSLKSVNLSKLITTNVENMDFMFYNCKLLTSINLSNFDTSKVTWIESMFDGCSKLEYINLKNFVENKYKNLNYTNIFRDTPENIVICLNESNAPNLNALINNKKCNSLDCSDDWKQSQKIIKNDTEKCIHSCNGIINLSYEKEKNCQMTCYCETCKKDYYQKDNE